MEFSSVALVLATLTFLWYLRKSRRDRDEKRRNGLKVPPGPMGLPIIGNLHQLMREPTKQWRMWSKEFGDIYQVQLGNKTLVVVSNPKWTREMFSDPVFSGRPYFEGFDIYEEHPKLGIINSEGDLWEQHRRFLLRQLRDFGFGKSAMETLIQDELTQVIDKFKEQQGKPVGSMKDTLRLALVNSLWSILSGERFNHDDPKLLSLALNTSKVFNEVIEGGMLLPFMPWLRHVAPVLSGYTKIRKVLNENEQFFRGTIEKHKKQFEEDDLKDFVDVYLAEVKKTTDASSHFYGEIAEKQLVASLFDMFLAGGDTTATTISWAVLYLCQFPAVQKNLQQEIEEITSGNSRSVTLGDRPSMPYTLALLDEVMRYASIAPDGVQHTAFADKEFHGYFIPKDAMLQGNLYFIHHDPRIWGDPENFRPERFLTVEEDGQTRKYTKSENLQPFLVGRRQCVGETLARDSIFLYVTHLFQKFTMEFDGERDKPSLEPEIGFLRSPLPYWVIMKDRQVGG